jgi:hypothetical protein
MILVIFFFCSTERQSKSEAKPRTPHNAESVDTCKGFRSISTSADGRYLSAGDRSGNLYVYDLHSLQIITHKVSFLAHEQRENLPAITLLEENAILLTADLSGDW